MDAGTLPGLLWAPSTSKDGHDSWPFPMAMDIEASSHEEE